MSNLSAAWDNKKFLDPDPDPYSGTLDQARHQNLIDWSFIKPHHSKKFC